MKTSSPLFLAGCAAFLAAAAPLAAQDAPPSNLAAEEIARTRMCVPAIARLQALESDLEPLVQRAERLRRLDAAIALEDSDRVTPFDEADPLEVAVRDWFRRDGELAQRYLDEGDDAVQEERRQHRQEIRQRVRDALEEIQVSGQERVASTENAERALEECQDAVLVRSTALEICETTDSPVCEEARSPEPTGRFRFVDAPEDLWDMEQVRPWTNPSRLGPGPSGAIGGARTGTLARRGNVTLVVSVEPIIRDRSEISEEEAAEYDANLDSLGITFDDSRYVMAPALSVFLDIPAPLGGETDYLLHFGDLSEPSEQVIWAIPAPPSGPVEITFPAPGWALAQLAEGHPMNLTAVHFPEGDDPEGDAVYTLGLTSVGQAPAVTQLLSYWVSGEFARDLAALIPTQPGSD